MKNAERRHMDRVAALRCLICRRPACVHHVREGQGMSQRASNFLVIPLCPDHHTDGGLGVAFHAGSKTFERIYGSELDLLAQTIEELQR
jgi:hypothetical protein